MLSKLKEYKIKVIQATIITVLGFGVGHNVTVKQETNTDNPAFAYIDEYVEKKQLEEVEKDLKRLRSRQIAMDFINNNYNNQTSIIMNENNDKLLKEANKRTFLKNRNELSSFLRMKIIENQKNNGFKIDEDFKKEITSDIKEINFLTINKNELNQLKKDFHKRINIHFMERKNFIDMMNVKDRINNQKAGATPPQKIKFKM